MMQFLAALQGMGANTMAALGEAGSALAGITDPINQVSKAFDAKSKDITGGITDAYKGSAFGQSGFAKGTGLDGLFNPSDDPNISKHSAYSPVSMGDPISSFRSVNQFTNNPSVGMLNSVDTGSDVGIPYVYDGGGALTDTEEKAIQFEKEKNQAVEDVINADPNLPKLNDVQPMDFTHGSLYSPVETVSVDDFLNNRAGN
jgi:hypothetical protein